VPDCLDFFTTLGDAAGRSEQTCSIRVVSHAKVPMASEVMFLPAYGGKFPPDFADTWISGRNPVFRDEHGGHLRHINIDRMM
jgi:hypothetical protein